MGMGNGMIKTKTTVSTTKKIVWAKYRNVIDDNGKFYTTITHSELGEFISLTKNKKNMCWVWWSDDEGNLHKTSNVDCLILNENIEPKS